jgi:hypothetical protein
LNGLVKRLLVVLALLAPTGCASRGENADGKQVALPAVPPGPLVGTGTAPFTFQGDDDDGCVWVVDGSGDRYAAMWPSGYVATFEPLIVRGPDGDDVATDGRSYMGGSGPVAVSPAIFERVPERCRTAENVWQFTAPPEAQE